MKIGIIVGRENTFPQAFIDRVNSKNVEGITAEFVKLGGTRLDDEVPYRVIVDRMSQEVPYYRVFLKKAMADGVIVINNPFWWTADDKFFECILAERLGVPVPRTVVLPNKSYEADVVPESFRNLVYPVPWNQIGEYVGLPAVLKPAMGGGWKNVSVVHTMDELLAAYDRSGYLTMILQEFIRWEGYARCFVLGRKDVLISGYDPSRPHHERYILGDDGLGDELRQRIQKYCLTLATALGYDMDTVEFAIRGGVPYAIDFLNPAPDFDYYSVQPPNFEWVVETMANLTIEYALGQGSPVTAADFRWQSMINAVPSIAQPG
jgi:glutathione synthase/RimK-type ligase-like ATP-grasp enzyme